MKRIAVVALLAAAACGTQSPGEAARERFINAPVPATPAPASLVMSGQTLYCGVPGMPACQNPAHAAHAAYMFRDIGGDLNGWCNNCHTGLMYGWFDSEFDPAGKRRPAYLAPTAANPNPPAPRFNGWDFFEVRSGVYNCSNIACHGVPERTYTAVVQGGDGEPTTQDFALPAYTPDTPIWGTENNGCKACHPAAPPAPWHGTHANNSFAGANDCGLCHRNVTGSIGNMALTSTALHGNGVADLAPRWRSRCFGCH